MGRREFAVGAFEPPPNQKFPGNFPFGVGSSRPTSNGKFPGNFPLDVKTKFEKKFKSSGSSQPVRNLKSKSRKSEIQGPQI